MRTMNHRPTISLALAAVTLLAWAGPTTAEDCGSPCTVTRQGLPTFRLVNTVDHVNDWDLETSAFGVELARASDDPNTGALRIGHHAFPNTLVLGNNLFGGIGMGTSVPEVNLQISDPLPAIRLDDTSAGAGKVDLYLTENRFVLAGNTRTSRIVQVDTRAPDSALHVAEQGNVGLGTTSPSATLHVAGDARVDGNVALGSSRTLKTGFEPVSPSQILSKLTDLPVASWRYKTEDESARHIGPFAEDFQRLFGLGDGETISVVDAQGVAFAAIQGLQERLAAKESELERRFAEKDARIAALMAQNAELTAHLAAIEKHLAEESRQGDGN